MARQVGFLTGLTMASTQGAWRHRIFATGGLLMQVIGLSLAIALMGCASARVPYTARQADAAEIVGFKNVRMPLDDDLTALAAKGFPTNQQSHRLKFLAISGGGSGGAFTVGALKAWTLSGKRPSFDIVSGVSTGALIAPFAFLGPRYDDTLEHLYTSGVASELVDRKFIARGLLGESLLKQQPLRRMVETYLNSIVLKEIAAEHRKGRNLIVLTTNLDTQRPILWDMGAIADSDNPGALKLFQDVLIASASIPGIFPAVQIKARVDGRDIVEMHSDGGSSSQVLTLPEAVMTSTDLSAPRGLRGSDIYLLINNTLTPEFAMTTNMTIPVMARAYSILVKSQTRQSLLAVYEYACRSGINFHVAAIDVAVPYSASDPFNQQYMRTVYQIGYDRMMDNTLWADRPVFVDRTQMDLVAVSN